MGAGGVGEIVEVVVGVMVSLEREVVRGSMGLGSAETGAESSLTGRSGLNVDGPGTFEVEAEVS